MIQLVVAQADGDEIVLLLTIDGKPHQHRLKRHVAASLIREVAAALAE